MKKAQREVLKEAWDTSWLLGGAGSGCHCMQKHVALGKLPFVSGPLFPTYPMGKTARSLLAGVLLQLYIKDHRVSGCCGDGNDMSTQSELKTWRKAFSNRSNLSQFCHLQLQRYKLHYFVCSGSRKTFFLSNTDSCRQQAKFWPIELINIVFNWGSKFHPAWLRACLHRWAQTHAGSSVCLPSQLDSSWLQHRVALAWAIWLLEGN